MLLDIGSVENIPAALARAKDRNDPWRLFGFGHRVYKSHDPRAVVMKGVTRELLAHLGCSNDPALKVAVALEEAATKDECVLSCCLFRVFRRRAAERKKSKGKKQLDFYSRSPFLLFLLFLLYTHTGTLSAATSTRTSTSTRASACGPWASPCRCLLSSSPSRAASGGARRCVSFVVVGGRGGGGRRFRSRASFSLSRFFFLSLLSLPLFRNLPPFFSVDGNGCGCSRRRPEDRPPAADLHGTDGAPLPPGTRAGRRVRQRWLRDSRRERGQALVDLGRGGSEREKPPPPSSSSSWAQLAARCGGRDRAMREGDSEAESEKEEQQTHLAFVHLLSFVARFDFFPEAIQINQRKRESRFTAIFYL